MSAALKALGIVALLVFPFVVTSPYYLLLVVVIGITAIVAVGLDVVFGYTGEVSLGHSALFGIGAYTAGVFAWQLGWGIGPALIAGPLVAALFGAILAFPALRVTGPYLAMVTLAFGTIVEILINEMTFLTDGPMGISLRQPLYYDWRGWSDWLPFLGMPIARLRQVQNYYVVMVCLVLTLVVVSRLLASRFGRAFEALRDSPIASDCMGVSVYRYKVLAFVVSAGFAGLAGVLFAYSVQYLSPNNFDFNLTITFLLAVTMGGRKSRTGPIIGAAIVVLLPNILADINLFRWLAGLIAVVAVVVGGVRMLRRPEERLHTAIPVVLCLGFFAFALLLTNVTDYKLTIFGLMILFVVYYLPDGIFGWLRQSMARQWPGWVRLHPVVTEHGSEAEAWAPPRAADPARPLLELRGVTMQFGGLKALDAVDLVVRPGMVHGLIGPNGSGKSTMMNVLTGIYTPTEGDILFEGVSIAGWSSSRIAAAGIARTFQNVQLFAELTCVENVMVGLHHSYRGGVAGVALGLVAERRAEHAARMRATGLLRFVGLEVLANEEARNLPYGKMRLLEIARALALDPLLLLLDEPAAGLTLPDLAELQRIIERIREHGITLLLIEHHVDLVMSVCDTVTVLDFGQKIAEGLPAYVQADARVIAAYLGGEPVQVGGVAMLQVENLVAGYGNVRVLHSISLSVPDGTLVTLIGSNGAGKTTTLRALSGMLRPESGRILLNGVDVAGLPSHEITRLGLAHSPEGRRVFPTLSVQDNLLLGAFTRLTGRRGRGEVSADLDRMYTLFPRLAERRSQLGGTLSGGEQQMLAIARALMLRPMVLLLDEPSMGLAPRLVEEVFAIVSRLKGERVTMLLVEQFAAAALAVADFGYVLENGRLAASGPAAALRDDAAVRAAYLGAAH